MSNKPQLHNHGAPTMKGDIGRYYDGELWIRLNECGNGQSWWQKFVAEKATRFVRALPTESKDNFWVK